MIKSTVEPACTGQFSPLFLDYLRGKENLKPFYHFSPNLSDFEKAIDERKFSHANREVLVKALKKQYGHLEIREAVEKNIQALSDSRTFTVTTGHQLNLFTGPLYFIYKIVSTINLAKKLQSTYPDAHFVPVYWMATEDHDFAEINHFTFEGRKYTWETDQKGAVGDFELDASLQKLVQSLSFIPEFFKNAYQKNRLLSEAVREYVDVLFGSEGLVVVDGNDHTLKQLFVPMIQEDLMNHTANDLVNAQTERLAKEGYESQIFPREINFFYMDKGIRERIIKEGENYKVMNSDQAWNREEILALVSSNPEKFSPNVVMRPLYQEVILPNLAYLGGPAEVIYWLQLKTVFDHHKIDFPIILPRNFALLLDGVIQRKVDQLGLKEEELFVDFLSLKKEFVSTHTQHDLTLEEEADVLAGIFEQLGQKGFPIDKTLKEAASAAKVRAMKILEQMAVKFRKAEERNLKVELDRMEAVKAQLFPNGSPQERVENFLPFYLQDPTFISQLMEVFDPLDFNFNILKLNGAQTNH
ncbi:bacillithiol biosynthesis cysteine-adding enzyme BshC [Pararhodonellum marinum]|uniref:bacillithiol biosynthesis cysteine-adding enzyme BshC n=1 Tax=Pararhodonellum marinum TaxID=2755358 RepID=UPI00188E5CDF|nr:bacillithiol biosynthesis cysteine-adding enzyme BshC [Pararhodonellum marinum]